ncbi:MAG: TraB/GumN family protein [Mariniphaga sp.]|nr:TraB/GumN family protein [Mariniphaga sp.]
MTKSHFAYWKLIVEGILIYFVICSCSKSGSIEGGLLWEISGNGLQKPSYLFGTNHGMSEHFLDSIPGVFEAFNSVKQFVVESDFTRPRKSDSLKPVNIYLPPDTTYKDLLDEKELAVLDSVCLIYFNCLSEKVNLNPNALITSLQLGMIKRQSQKWAKVNPFLKIINNRHVSIDSKLMRLAQEKSYPIIELDSEEKMEQLGLRDYRILFSSDDLQFKAKELVQSIMELQQDSLMDISKKMVQAYYEQDLSQVEKWIFHPKLLKKEKSELFYNTLFVKRNIFWMDKILYSIRKTPAFIMVGAGHLPGKNGLINLLKDEGYVVKPIK